MDHSWTCTQLVERALPTKCSLFTSCRGPFPTVSATKWPDMQICNQSQIPVHAPRIPEGAHAVGPYRGSHECAVSWEVTYDFSIVDTGRRTPELAGTPPPLSPGPDNAQTGRERDEKRQRTEPIDESPGDGGADVAALLRRAAGDIAARAAHPGPHHRPRPSTAAGVPVRHCPGASCGGRGRRLSSSPPRLPPFGSRSSRPHARLTKCNSQSCDCPVGVEGATESNCSLRCSRQPHSPRFQLRNRSTCNLPPHPFSCTWVTHPERSHDSRAP